MPVKKKPVAKTIAAKKSDTYLYTARGDMFTNSSIKEIENEILEDVHDGEEFEIWKLVKIVRVNCKPSLEEIK